MKKVICSNSTNPHYYNSDEYDACPHCGAAPLADNDIPVKKSISVKLSPEKKDQSKMNKVKGERGDKTFGIFKKSKNMEDDLPWKTNDDGRMPDSLKQGTEEPSSQSTRHSDIPASGEGTSIKINNANKGRAESENMEKDDKKGPIKKTNCVGKTQGFFYIPDSGDENKTTAVISNSGNDEPCCVGWLVCVKGMYFGHNFPIYSGRNSIGRNTNNKIAILNDMSVSGEKHSWIVYEPKKREFYVQPGEGSGLTYLKKSSGEEVNVMGTERIVHYDKIEIGKGIYMLITLCSEQFTWEDYMEVK